jgi:hypothetical protein
MFLSFVRVNSREAAEQSIGIDITYRKHDPTHLGHVDDSQFYGQPLDGMYALRLKPPLFWQLGRRGPYRPVEVIGRIEDVKWR